jgi:hypothetical protein
MTSNIPRMPRPIDKSAGFHCVSFADHFDPSAHNVCMPHLMQIGLQIKFQPHPTPLPKKRPFPDAPQDRHNAQEARNHKLTADMKSQPCYLNGKQNPPKSTVFG